jgi:hypothetical protein
MEGRGGGGGEEEEGWLREKIRQGTWVPPMLRSNFLMSLCFSWISASASFAAPLTLQNETATQYSFSTAHITPSRKHHNHCVHRRDGQSTCQCADGHRGEDGGPVALQHFADLLQAAASGG